MKDNSSVMKRLDRRNLLWLGAVWPWAAARADKALTPAPCAAARTGSPQLVASFPILADMAREILPAPLSVAALVGHEADAHAWQDLAHAQRCVANLVTAFAQRRRVITGHDAFGYFVASHGVDFLALRGWSTDSKPSATAVARLVRQIRDNRVQAVFLENICDPRLVQRIAEEGGAQVGGTLYSDALSAPGGPGATASPSPPPAAATS